MKRKIIAALFFISALINVAPLKANASLAKISVQKQIEFPPLIEGYFYRNLVDEKIYWYVNGQLRHIINGSTYNYVFKDPGKYLFNIDNFSEFIKLRGPVADPSKTIVGPSIAGDTELILVENTVYFRMGGPAGAYFIIPNPPQTMDIYHFNWDSIMRIPAVLGGIVKFPENMPIKQ